VLFVRNAHGALVEVTGLKCCNAKVDSRPVILGNWASGSALLLDQRRIRFRATPPRSGLAAAGRAM